MLPGAWSSNPSDRPDSVPPLARRELPFPPPEPRRRASILPARDDDHAGYLERGADTRRAIESALPASWPWTGARVLDFGCGYGRVLDEARDGEFWGAEIDERCIQWDKEHLNPAMRFVVNGEVLPLPFADASFDLVYVMSVFTHITEHWASWLLEPGEAREATALAHEVRRLRGEAAALRADRDAHAAAQRPE